MQQNAVFLNMNHAKCNNMQWGILLLHNRIQASITDTTPAKCNRMHQTSKSCLACSMQQCCNNFLELVHSVAFSRVRVNKYNILGRSKSQRAGLVGMYCLLHVCERTTALYWLLLRINSNLKMCIPNFLIELKQLQICFILSRLNAHNYLWPT